MKAELSGPADTSTMRIVHTALRRDLARAQTALTEPPYPDRAQRAARSIGLEQARLAHDAGRRLDDRRHVGVAVGDPARQPLWIGERRPQVIDVRAEAIFDPDGGLAVNGP